jgi:hypothetical protein
VETTKAFVKKRKVNQRVFCISRIEQRGEKQKKFFLDPPDLISDGDLELQAGPNGNHQVCSTFFLHVVGKSTNFLAQPSIRRKKISPTLSVKTRSRPKFDAVVLWLLDTSV